MKLNKALQYALLLVLYLCRAGRARLQDVAANLKLSLPFLRVVAHKLRASGVILSVRGPGGGYEVNKDPSVRDVFDAISPVKILTNVEIKNYSVGEAEHRTLKQLAMTFDSALGSVLRRKMRALNKELAANEMATLDRFQFGAVN